MWTSHTAGMSFSVLNVSVPELQETPKKLYVDIKIIHSGPVGRVEIKVLSRLLRSHCSHQDSGL